jgi:hypothetical protein
MLKHIFQITILVAIGAFLLSACSLGGGNETPTPTMMSVDEIFTAAAQTVIAQITQQAPITQPTSIFTDTPLVITPSITPLPSRTLPPPTATNCANSRYVADVTIPDGTQLPVGQEFTKTWSVQNTGTCTWTTSFRLAFSYGEAMGGQSVAFANLVSPGETVNISVNLKVPNKSGKLTGVWMLVDNRGQHFGELLTVVINVGALSPTATGSVTGTPTLTPIPGGSTTPTSTATYTPASTATPTNTSAPTDTSTYTPTATQ